MTKYSVKIAWRTIAKNVFQLTRETEQSPATYRMEVGVIDSNDKGAGEKVADMWFTDFIGNPYLVIDLRGDSIDVSDFFRIGDCPYSGKNGWLHKSAYKGYSAALPSDCFRHLHPMAMSHNQKYSMSVLWGNDPNPIRIPFTDTNTPSILNYQQEQENGKRLWEDFGENPKVQLFTKDSDGLFWERQEKPIWNRDPVTDELLSIVFDLSDNYSGYIILSR